MQAIPFSFSSLQASKEAYLQQKTTCVTAGFLADDSSTTTKAPNPAPPTPPNPPPHQPKHPQPPPPPPPPNLANPPHPHPTPTSPGAFLRLEGQSDAATTALFASPLFNVLVSAGGGHSMGGRGGGAEGGGARVGGGRGGGVSGVFQVFVVPTQPTLIGLSLGFLKSWPVWTFGCFLGCDI